jgi:hypothetical protein
VTLMNASVQPFTEAVVEVELKEKEGADPSASGIGSTIRHRATGRLY